MDKDEVCYARFLNGDHQALEELIGTHRGALTLFLYSYVHDMTEAENLMIDTFAQLVVQGGRFQKKASLKTYLFTIGRNEALRHLKKNRRHLSWEELPEGLAQDEEHQIFGLLRQERYRQLYDAMENLKSEYREVLYLIYFEQMSYREAAQVMKKSEKQITNLAYRGKKALKGKLEAGGFAYYE